MITDEQVLDRYPVAPIDRDNVDLYRGYLERELRLNRCDECGMWRHPPRPICPCCWSGRIVPTPVSGRGVVHLMTVLHVGPPAPGIDYREGHPVVTVQLEEAADLRFSASLVDASRKQRCIGMPVDLTWVDRGGAPVPAFRPVQTPGVT